MGQSLSEAFEAANRGDYATALENWRPLAEQGDADAQFNMGVSYQNGLGVAQDDSEAVFWYRQAAEQGDKYAQYNLGLRYYNGQGVTHNPVMAYMLNILSADQGHELARNNRDVILSELSSSQVDEAQLMASKWLVGTALPLFSDFTTWP